MDGADPGTDVEHARAVDTLPPENLDQLPCRRMQLPGAPPCQVGLGAEAVIGEAREVLVAAESTRRVRCHRPMVRRASTAG